jgi:hypothetical protein
MGRRRGAGGCRLTFLELALWPAVVYHLLLGLGLFCLLWAAGLGVVATFPGSSDVRARAAFAYPAGLALAFAAAALYLYRSWLGVLSIALLLAPIVLLVLRQGLAKDVWRLARRPLAFGGPAAVGLALGLGTYFHGPDRAHDSGAGGDVVFYAGRIVAARHSLFPFWDLAAAGHRYTYAESGPSVLGAPLSHLRGFDPFLFNATTLPLVMLLSVLVGIGLIDRRRGPASRGLDVLVVSMLAVSMVPYPSWMVESSPVTLAVPLAFSMYGLYRYSFSARATLGWVGLLAVAAFLTKIVVLVPLGILVGAALWRDHRQRLAERRFGLAGGLGVVAAALVSAFLLTEVSFADLLQARFVTWSTFRGLIDVGQDNYRPAGIPLALIGLLFLCVGLLRARRYALTTAVACPVALAQFVGGVNFEMAISAAVLVVALDVWSQPGKFAVGTWFAAAGAALSAAAVVRDISPLRSADVFLILLALTVAGGLTASERRWQLYRVSTVILGISLVFALAGRGVLAFVVPFALIVFWGTTRSPTSWVRGGGAIGIASVLLAGLGATVHAVSGDNFRLRAASTVPNLRPLPSRDDWDLWSHVETITEPHALIFTSLTGMTVDEEHGWNYYAMLADRQIYIAGWVDGDLRVKPHALAARLRSNSAVLSGRVPACGAPGARAFSPYYAVLRNGELSPPGAQLRYRSDAFAIYRLSGCDG